MHLPFCFFTTISQKKFDKGTKNEPLLDLRVQKSSPYFAITFSASSRGKLPWLAIKKRPLQIHATGVLSVYNYYFYVVGTIVGSAVGTGVGSGVGAGVGAAVGAGVGVGGGVTTTPTTTFLAALFIIFPLTTI